MTTITPEQRLALSQAGDSPVELADPQTGTAYILIRAEDYRKLRDLVAQEEGGPEEVAWAKVARKVRDRWAEENPY